MHAASRGCVNRKKFTKLWKTDQCHLSSITIAPDPHLGWRKWITFRGFWAPPAPWPMSNSLRPILVMAHWKIFLSIIPDVKRWYMNTGHFWPSQWIWAMAYRSCEGFQSLSTRTNREALIRFNPTPPALVLRRKITGGMMRSIELADSESDSQALHCEEQLNLSTRICWSSVCIRLRGGWDMPPSNQKYMYFLHLQWVSIKSNVAV